MRLLSCIQDSDDRKGLSDPCPQAESFSFGACFLKIMVKRVPRTKCVYGRFRFIGAYSRRGEYPQRTLKQFRPKSEMKIKI